MKICPVEAELFHANGQMNGQPYGRTDRVKLSFAFCNFGKVPKNCTYKTFKLKNIMKWFHNSVLILDFSDMLSN